PALVAVVSALALRAGYATVSSIAAVAAAFVTIGQAGRRTPRPLNGLLAPALDEIDCIEARGRAKEAAKELQVERGRDEIATRISELEREQLQVTRRRGELEAELTAFQQGSKKTLKDFILRRVASDEYRKNLGVIAAVHRDFKELSSFLAPSADPPNVE